MSHSNERSTLDGYALCGIARVFSAFAEPEPGERHLMLTAWTTTAERRAA